MKFDRRRPEHWLRVTWLSFVLVVSSLIAWMLPRSREDTIVLSGHALNGNLQALSVASASSSANIKWFYLAMSKSTMPVDQSTDALRLWRVRDAVTVSRSRMVVTDHGPGLLSILQRLRPQVEFVDVWHGVGFRALGKRYEGRMRRYRSVVAASQWDAEDQVRTAGIRASQVETLGYGLMDSVVAAARSRPVLEPGRRRLLLVAPTWSYDHSDSYEELAGARITDALGRWADRRGWDVVVRAHLNSAESHSTATNVQFKGMAAYPDTVNLMISADALITDWSSIATDFYGLGRPVVFWDRPCPFSAFRMTPEDRVGPVVGSVDALIDVLDSIDSDGCWYSDTYGAKQKEVLERFHGAGLDGEAALRLVELLSSRATT